MAYSVPELLLVGAAQSLVLDTSGLQNTVGQCLLKEYDDIEDGIYDGSTLW